LIGVSHYNSFEAEAAIALESSISQEKSFPINIVMISSLKTLKKIHLWKIV